VRGWAVAEQGLPAEGIAQMRESLGVHRAMHLQVVFTYFLALFAETLARNRNTGEALGAVTEAFEVMRTTGQRMYEAELHRLKGELLLQVADGNAAEAEACFREALVIASHQQAKSLELQAAVSAARLWKRQGKKTEARDVLAPIYDWFTEGFDTADLRDAKELLDTLV